MEKELHIICPDVPCPADYGCVIDIMNRIRALHAAGIRIHLHYFSDNQCTIPIELTSFCRSVYLYAPRAKKQCGNNALPYNIAARINDLLIGRLNADDHPILIEGLSCTGIIPFLKNIRRSVCIRMHTNEELYYKALAQTSSGIFKKFYYAAEGRHIKKYIATLPKQTLLACVSEPDRFFFKELGFNNAFFLPTFPNWQRVNSLEGIGTHCLFHGTLSVPDNEQAALWLLHKVFNKVRVPFIIAGKDPSRQLQKAAALCEHTCLVSNPCESEINDLVQKAHINILPNLNKNCTGTRLKLLHALYSGRHCVTTPSMIAESGLEATCHIGTTPNALASIISQLYYKPFEADEIHLRKTLVEKTFNNSRNTACLMNQLWLPTP
ncbi:MAG: glycosyltransferase family 4 protein [Niabella sp.]|nr:glycosyltransferase family 4 protein [Niabella sp.]